MNVGLVSVPRSGKHWLLSGIFDSLNCYPTNYLEEIFSHNTRISIKTDHYSIKIDDIKFSSCHSDKELIKSFEKIVFLDRKDKVSQAISWLFSNNTNMYCIYHDNDKRKFDNMTKLKRLTKNDIKKAINILEGFRETLITNIQNYVTIFYEDLQINYEKVVKEVIYFLFNKNIKEVKYVFPSLQMKSKVKDDYVKFFKKFGNNND